MLKQFRENKKKIAWKDKKKNVVWKTDRIKVHKLRWLNSDQKDPTKSTNENSVLLLLFL